jgi:hypothetical protein
VSRETGWLQRRLGFTATGIRKDSERDVRRQRGSLTRWAPPRNRIQIREQVDSLVVAICTLPGSILRILFGLAADTDLPNWKTFTESLTRRGEGTGSGAMLICRWPRDPLTGRGQASPRATAQDETWLPPT